MRNPDAILIGWWLLLTAVALGTWVSARTSSRQDHRAVEMAYLRGDVVNAYRPFPNPVWTPLGRGALVIGCILVIAGVFALFEMRDWTELHVLNARFFLLLFSFGFGLAAWNYKHRDRAKQILARVALAIIAALMILVGGASLFGDLFGERRVVEGRLTSIAVGRKNDRHQLFVDGRKYNATRDVYQQAWEGKHVRLSIGAGSGTVFALEQLD